MPVFFLDEMCLHLNWVAQEFNLRPCPWLVQWYLEYPRPSFQWTVSHESNHISRDILSNKKIVVFEHRMEYF